MAKMMSGHDRAVMTAYWIKHQLGKGEKAVGLEAYIKKVCKAKNLTYKPPNKKEG